MDQLLGIHSLLFLIGSPLSYFAVRTKIDSMHSEDLMTLKWEAGDVLACILKGPLGFFGSKHWMLAVDSNSFIHLSKPRDVESWISRKGVIKEEPRERMTLNHDKCYNFGKTYEMPVDQVIEKARKYVNQEHYINLLFCNCQHWVNRMTQGTPGFSTSSLMWAVPWCPYYGETIGEAVQV